MNPIRIEDWIVVTLPAAQHVAPECQSRHLSGVVTDHPQRPGGGPVTTSPIVGRRGPHLVTKNGTVYELGKMRDGFERQFPEVNEWLRSGLKELEPEFLAVAMQRPLIFLTATGGGAVL